MEENNKNLEEKTKKEDFIKKSKSKEEKKKIKKEDKTNKEKVNKSKNKIIFSTIFLGIIIVALLYLFAIPVKADYTSIGSTTTTNGVLDTNINIKCNKPINKIYYGIDVENKDNKEEYKEIEARGSIFSKKISLSDISIPVGKRKLYLYVESLFGKYEIIDITINFKLGYIAEFDINNTTSIGDSDKIVSNELLITFKEDTSSKKAKSVIEKYDGEIVGELYYLNQYQVRFKSSGEEYLKSLTEKLSNEDTIDLVLYNKIINENVNAEESSVLNQKKESNKPDISISEVVTDKNLRDFLYEKVVDSSKDEDGKYEYLRRMNVVDAWKLLEGRERSIVNVGVIDSYLYYNHEDFNIKRKNICYLPSTTIKTYEELTEYFKNDVKKGNSYKDHGTNVTGIIAAQDNGVGTFGINPSANIFFSNAWLYSKNGDSVKRTKTEFERLYQISYMAMSNCRVINMSIGTDSQMSNESKEYIDRRERILYERTFEKLEQAGKDFLIVKSAGNGDENGDFDASLEKECYLLTCSEKISRHVIIVGAVGGSNALSPLIYDIFDKAEYDLTNNLIETKTSYSNYGDTVDVYATGTVYSEAFGDSEYCKMTGTSQATPIVTGLASLIYSVNPDFTYDQVKEIIIETANGRVSTKGKEGRIIDAYAAIQEALNYDGEVKKSDTNNVIYGFLRGTVEDATTQAPVSTQIEMIIYDKSDESKFYYAEVDEKYTDEDNDGNSNTEVGYGIYDLILPVGKYKMCIYADGYIPTTIDNIEVTEGVVTNNPKLIAIEQAESNSQGLASGMIVNAFDGSGIPGTELRFYTGVNTDDVAENENSEKLIATATSDEYGKYSIKLDPGAYTVYASKSDYIKGYGTVYVISNQTRNNQDIAVTPKLKEGEIRVVLTWGESPRDIDSHLIGPTPDGSTFHTCFWNKNYYYNDIQYDNLDLDDTSSYGPETTSVYVGVSGTYTFYVHDYTNKNATDSDALGNSGATVKVYIAGQEEPIVYYVPNEKGTIWKVFSITNGQVTPINEMSYDISPISRDSGSWYR